MILEPKLALAPMKITKKALSARNAEGKGDIKVCFDEWRRVFGHEFPEHRNPYE